MKEYQNHKTLEEIVQWCVKTKSRIIDIIVQDEFTQDIIVQYSDNTFLVYDSS